MYEPARSSIKGSTIIYRFENIPNLRGIDHDEQSPAVSKPGFLWENSKSGEPRMVNHTFQQFTGLSCGAASLLVAAVELGVQAFPAEGFRAMSGRPLVLSNSCEREIYNLTANGAEDYSMPHDLARVAQLLGMGVDVYLSGCLIPRYLEWQYPHVRTGLDRLGIDIGNGAPTLNENERMLMAVGIGILGLHWVLYRPDTTYMDPAYSQNYTSLYSMGQLGVLRYIDIGVYVVVRHGQVV